MIPKAKGSQMLINLLGFHFLGRLGMNLRGQTGSVISSQSIAQSHVIVPPMQFYTRFSNHYIQSEIMEHRLHGLKTPFWYTAMPEAGIEYLV
jgi:hypothetical protein